MIHTKIQPAFSDERGSIADVLYKHEVNHVGLIESVAGVVRGNHYHKLTTQHTLVTRGSLRYFWRAVDGGEVQSEIVRAGEMASSPPNEIHAMYMFEQTQIVVLSEGVRGGVDYESDTFREIIVTAEQAQAAT